MYGVGGALVVFAPLAAAWLLEAEDVEPVLGSRATDTLSGLGGFAPPTMHALGARLGGMVSRRLYNVVITNVEYPANRYPWEDLRRFGVEVIDMKAWGAGKRPAVTGPLYLSLDLDVLDLGGVSLVLGVGRVFLTVLNGLLAGREADGS